MMSLLRSFGNRDRWFYKDAAPTALPPAHPRPTTTTWLQHSAQRLRGTSYPGIMRGRS